MQIPALKHTPKWLWVGVWMLGNMALLSVISILLWRQATATSWAQAAVGSARFTCIALFMIFWGTAPAILLARRRKTPPATVPHRQ
jgi:hypothetical protein